MAVRTTKQKTAPITKQTIKIMKGWPSIRTSLLVSLLILAILTGLGLNYHIQARARYAEIRQLTTQLRVPKDARLTGESGKGNGLEAYLCIDVPCPSYSFTYVVPLVPGTEMQTVQAVLQESGYTVMDSSEDSCEKEGDWTPICYASNRANDLLVYASIDFPPKQAQSWVPTTEPPAGREWRQLHISISDY
jgi:hypothetical protein